MKMLENFPDETQARDWALTLRSHGILTHLGTSQYPFFSQTSLWVVMEEQFQDAEALLRDPSHRVVSGLPEEELAELEKQMEAQAPQFWDGVLTHPLFLLVMGGLVFLFLLALRGTSE